jgi:hypothetical protein
MQNEMDVLIHDVMNVRSALLDRYSHLQRVPALVIVLNVVVDELEAVQKDLKGRHPRSWLVG